MPPASEPRGAEQGDGRTKMKDGIELRKVIDQLREELFALTETVGGEDLRFAVESVEVELHVGVT